MNSRKQTHRPTDSGATSSKTAALAIAFLMMISAAGLTGCGKSDDKSGNVNAPVVDGNFPIAEPALSNAIIGGDMAEIQKIIASGADVNAKDALGRTPMHIAAFYGRTKVMELLLAGGADINARDHTGMAPLHAAAISGGRQSVQFLLDKQADIHATNEAGQTALHLAAATGQPKLTKFLVERSADPHKKDSDGKTPLFYAKKNYHPQTTATLEQIVAKKPQPPVVQK